MSDNFKAFLLDILIILIISITTSLLNYLVIWRSWSLVYPTFHSIFY
ncbi:hypothetical protein [Methanobrevibacter arboriphilus]|nr:hypothetical protein [Methanobrevibacter arboriphilus]